MVAIHKINKIEFVNNYMIINIDGNELKISLEKLSIKLRNATKIERTIYKISPTGYGIHWPLIDEDLSIEGIIRDFVSS